MEVNDEGDAQKVMEQFKDKQGLILPDLDHISHLGMHWYIIFYEGDKSFTVGPEGKIYNTTCGV